MTTYEYHILNIRGGYERREDFQEQLNDLGKEGWLLVLETGNDLIFVRPKPNSAVKVKLVWGPPQMIPERN